MRNTATKKYYIRFVATFIIRGSSATTHSKTKNFNFFELKSNNTPSLHDNSAASMLYYFIKISWLLDQEKQSLMS